MLVCLLAAAGERALERHVAICGVPEETSPGFLSTAEMFRG